jgi:hypothetical protein
MDIINQLNQVLCEHQHILLKWLNTLWYTHNLLFMNYKQQTKYIKNYVKDYSKRAVFRIEIDHLFKGQ